MSKEEENEKTIKEKAEELINMGWSLLNEKCPKESCNCPLLKSLDGNKYCIQCEMWQFPDRISSRQKYTDLVLKAHQELAIRETGVQKLKPKFINFNVYGKDNVLNALQIKLAYLTSQLNETTDQSKTKIILENIELCIRNIKQVNETL